MIILTRNEVRALVAFANDDPRARESISCLRCLRFDTENDRVIATDGHSLAALHRGINKGEPFSVPIGRIKIALRLLVRVKDELHVRRTDKAVILTAVRDGECMGCVIVDVNPEVYFPDVDKVIPSHDRPAGATLVRFDPAFMSRLALIKKACSSGVMAMHCPPGELDPILFRMESWTIVIMPSRTKEQAIARIVRGADQRGGKGP